MATNLEDKVKELEAKIAELYDREALRDLRYRYHECINEAQMAEIPELFTEDGELEFGHLGKAKGREQIKAFFSGLGRDPSTPENRRGLYRVRQFIHNHALKVNGDRASGYAYLEAKPVYNGESYVVAARYNDECIKRNDGKWLFTKMSLTPFFMVPLKEGWAGNDLLKMGR